MMGKEHIIPSPGESITEVVISKWLKTNGEYVEKDDEIAEIESDKATLILIAECSGVLKIVAQEGEDIKVGSIACVIEPGKRQEKSETKSKSQTGAVVEKQISPGNEVAYTEGLPSPAASKIIREIALESQKIEGTGKGGRITKGDALAAQLKFGQVENEKMQISKPVRKTTVSSREERREKMSNLRRRISEKLVQVKNQTALLTTFNEIDMSAVKKIRADYKERFKEKHQVGLGFMSFFSKAVAEALSDFPAVNAYIEGEEIVYHNYVDLGIAVSAPKGLMVPVIRNAEKLSLAEIEHAIGTLATKARSNRISIEEMTGGTFTITNGGVFGSMLSTPIVNPPQSAILGMHNIVDRPVAVNGAVEIRPIMYVALSYDHRIIDGRESVRFLYRIKELIEDPFRLMLGV